MATGRVSPSAATASAAAGAAAAAAAGARAARCGRRPAGPRGHGAEPRVVADVEGGAVERMPGDGVEARAGGRQMRHSRTAAPARRAA